MPIETKDKTASDFAAEFLQAVTHGVIKFNTELLADVNSVRLLNSLISKAYLLKED